MKVRTIRKHQNGFGGKFVKAVRSKYELPETEARGLIKAGLVVELASSNDATPAQDPKESDEV